MTRDELGVGGRSREARNEATLGVLANLPTPTAVPLPIPDLVQAARDLNEYVVCLDRIFSRLGTGEYPDSLLTDYLVERQVMQRLARLRETVFDALEGAVGAEEAERIAEESYVYADSTERK